MNAAARAIRRYRVSHPVKVGDRVRSVAGFEGTVLALTVSLGVAEVRVRWHNGHEGTINAKLIRLVEDAE